jgi:hypothetical protein
LARWDYTVQRPEALAESLPGRAYSRRVGGEPVGPAYDHAEITAIAAASIAYEMLCLFG